MSWREWGECDHVLIWGIPALAWRNWEVPENLLIVDFPTEICDGIFRIQFRNLIVGASLFFKDSTEKVLYKIVSEYGPD
jgi:hypothetical protein